MKKATLILLTIISSICFADPGDTTSVLSLDNAQLTWWGADEAWGVFPNQAKAYRKILMDVELGCADGGCSDWDYTVQIEGYHQTGEIDSVLVPIPNFTVNGDSVSGAYYFSWDTTYITSWNAFTSSVDSTPTAIKEVFIYGDTNNYTTPTDTLYVWDANFDNDIYDNSGNVTSTATVSHDSILITEYIYRYVDFEIINKYELGRFMTPYGGYMATSQHGYDNNWSHLFTYDVTDYAQMFHDSVKIRAFYGGWSAGFSVTVTFRMIEGNPVREVLEMHSLYQSGPGGWRSDNAANYENNYAVPKTISINSNTVGAMTRIIPSGHGFVNSQNCAEFCDRDYYLKVDGTTRFTQAMWRDDCGLNPIFPQGGTWLYDRANWCPGDKTNSYDHEITPYIAAGTNVELDLDMQIFDLTVPQGETPPNYIVEGQLFEYGPITATNDVEIADIISPSNKNEHSRKNPICGAPVIEIRNNGSATLTSLTINYGVEGANQQTYNWSGSLDFNESEILKLEPLNDWNGSSSNFEVTLTNPNGSADEYDLDNTLKTSFTPVDVYPNDIVISVTTNARSFHNEYSLYSADRIEITYNDLPGNYTTYSDTMNLTNGCYEFLLTDSEKNGLYWWAASSEGYGEAKFQSSTYEDSTYLLFQSDFGTEIRYQFMVDNSLSTNAKRKAEKIKVYPNPSTGVFSIQSDLLKEKDSKLEVFDMIGNIVYSESAQSSNGKVFIDLSNMSKGIYIINLFSNKGIASDKISLTE